MEKRNAKAGFILLASTFFLVTLIFAQPVRLNSLNDFKICFNCNSHGRIPDKYYHPHSPDCYRHPRFLEEFSHRSFSFQNNFTSTPAFPPPAANTGSWISLGPEGGWIQTLVMDPTNHQTIYAQTYGNPSQLYKSIDGGASWTFINSFPDSYNPTMTIDPNNPSILYTSYGRYLYKSLDGGINWNQYQMDSTLWPYITDIFVSPSNSNLIYTGGSYYDSHSYNYIMVVYKSMDGGLNWTRYYVTASNEYNYAMCFSINPNNTNEMYIGGSALYKSIDGGVNWSNITGIIYDYVYSLVIDPVSPNKIYAGTYNGIFRSDNSGASWLQNNGWVYSYELAIDPQNTNVLYSGYYGEAFKSIDGGINWTLYNNGLIGPCTSLLVDYIATQNVYYGGAVGIFKSIDSGMNWSETNSGLIASTITCMGIAPSDPTTTYIEFDNNAVFKTTNSGDDWIRLPDFSACGNIGAIKVDPLSTDIAYALEGSG